MHMPSTNQISFERTVDKAYTSVLPPSDQNTTFARNAKNNPVVTFFTLRNIGVIKNIQNNAYKYQ